MLLCPCAPLLQVTGFDIPHTFPEDYQPVFGMDVWHCVSAEGRGVCRALREWGMCSA